MFITLDIEHINVRQSTASKFDSPPLQQENQKPKDSSVDANYHDDCDDDDTSDFISTGPDQPFETTTTPSPSRTEDVSVPKMVTKSRKILQEKLEAVKASMYLINDNSVFTESSWSSRGVKSFSAAELHF